jgi:hypothetical protein
MNDPLSQYMFIRKDVVFQVVSNLRDPCIGTNLSIWILHAGVHRVSRDAYDPWWAPDKQGHQDRQLRGAGLGPCTWFGRPGYRLL